MHPTLAKKITLKYFFIKKKNIKALETMREKFYFLLKDSIFHELLKPIYTKSAFYRQKIKWIISKSDIITTPIGNFFPFTPPTHAEKIINENKIISKSQ